MSIHVVCVCGKKLVAKDEQAGMRAKCPACGKALEVPKVAAAPPQPKHQPTALAPSPSSAPSPASSVSPSPPPVPAAPAPLYEGQPLNHWFQLLGDNDPVERRKATEVLATVGPEAAAELPRLVERLDAEHVLLRHWAIVCLAQIGAAARPALEPLLERLADHEPLIRQKAAWAVGVVLPDAQPFVAALLRGLNDKAAEVRAAAIERFRRDLKTAGISRFRYWACSCGRVSLKADLEERLRHMADAPGDVSWQGEMVCTKCKTRYAVRDIYAGKHDVAEKYWTKLRARYGDALRVPEEFFGDLAAVAQDSGYRILDDALPGIPLDEAPSMAPFSAALLSEAFDEAANNSYKIADEPPPPRAVERFERREKNEKHEKQKR